MRTLAGPGSSVHFTNLSTSSCTYITDNYKNHDTDSVASNDATSACHTTGVLDMLKTNALGEPVDIKQVCLLDPKADQELSPEDGDGRFKCFLFGGILGDEPPRDRTGELRVLGFPARRLGPVQMTTDTALGVTKLVVKDKIKVDEIPYIDYPTIKFNAKESVEMPFRYIVKDGKPLLPPGMRELLHEDLNKSFDF